VRASDEVTVLVNASIGESVGRDPHGLSAVATRHLDPAFHRPPRVSTTHFVKRLVPAIAVMGRRHADQHRRRAMRTAESQHESA
jgi:hypothetical protein